MIDPRAGHPALSASKLLLHFICRGEIRTLVEYNDQRRVRAYVVSMDDWHRLEAYYNDQPARLKKSNSERPVLALTPELERDYRLYIKKPRRQT